MKFQVNTSGPCFTIEATRVESAKKKLLVLSGKKPKGWTSSWVRRWDVEHKVTLHYLVWQNSKGRKMGNHGAVMYRVGVEEGK